MVYEIKAIDQTGSSATVATEDAREALQSLRAFETAHFHEIIVRDETGRKLMASDLLKLATDLG